MEYIVGTLIVGLTLSLIINPFFSKQTKLQVRDMDDELDHLSLEQLYATLNELEMEYNMGKLAKEDYQSLIKQYEQIAAQKLKEEAYAIDKDDETKEE